MRPTQDARRTAIAVAGLVVFVVLGAALAGPWHLSTRYGRLPVLDITPPPLPTSDVTQAPLGNGESHQISIPSWVFVVILVVVLSIVALFAVPMVKRWLTGRGPKERDDDVDAGTPAGFEAYPATPALQEGVAQAARLLEDPDVPPGDAVIAAWVALEDAAARSGVVRDRAQTASEFTVAVLGATLADPAATRWLLGRYLDARYSEHVLTAADVQGARDALATLAEGVAHLRHAPTGVDEDVRADAGAADEGGARA